MWQKRSNRQSLRRSLTEWDCGLSERASGSVFLYIFRKSFAKLTDSSFSSSSLFSFQISSLPPTSHPMLSYLSFVFPSPFLSLYRSNDLFARTFTITSHFYSSCRYHFSANLAIVQSCFISSFSLLNLKDWSFVRQGFEKSEIVSLRTKMRKF